MKSKFKIVFISILLLTLVLSACAPQATPIAAPPAPFTAIAATLSAQVAQVTLSARLSEITGKVDVKQAGQNAFAPAKANSFLDENGQVQTGEDGRVRLDLSTGTIIRVAPASLFTLISNEPSEGSLKTSIEITLGRLFIILNGGSMEVQTPSGAAAVRGSYMSVSYDPNSGEVRITCLEGNCSLTSAGGSVAITAGQTAVVTGADAPPQVGEMSEQDIQDWLNNNPEASLVATPPAASKIPVATEPSVAPIIPPPPQLVFAPPIINQPSEPKEPPAEPLPTTEEPLPTRPPATKPPPQLLTPTVVINNISPSVSAMVGQPLTLNISVLPASGGPTPTGTVKVLANGISICTISLSAGSATCIGGIFTAGVTDLIAKYSGNGSYFAAQSAPLSYAITKASATVNVNSISPSVSTMVGETLSLDINVLPASGGPIPTGDINVLAYGIPICTITLNGSGNAICIGSISTVGSTDLIVDYSGDNYYLPVQITVVSGFSIGKASTSITISQMPNPSFAGIDSVAFTIDISAMAPGSGTPTGSVTIFDSAYITDTCTIPSAPGICNITFTNIGSRSVTINYNGDANFMSNSWSVIQDVQ